MTASGMSAVIGSALAIGLTTLTGAAASASAAAGTASAAAGGTLPGCGRWTVQTRANREYLDGVDARSPRDVWAAGAFSSVTAFRPLALHWNGRRWKAAPGQAIAAGVFSAISATSPTDAWAVGYDGSHQTLIEHWNGTRFSRVASPNPGGAPGTILLSVAATSAGNAWAVGYYYTPYPGPLLTVILRWNGQVWSQVPSPDPGTGTGGGSVVNQLRGVTAVSGTNAWAVGSYTDAASHSLSQTLIAHWNGQAWTQVPSPNPNHRSELTAVSAASARDAWAVGEYFDGAGDQTLIEHWNGHTWTRVPSPDPAGFFHGNNLLGVTDISARDAWAVGEYSRHRVQRTLLLHWNGSSWKTVGSPNPGSTANNWSLGAVSASSATNVWAVALGGLPGAEQQSLTLRC
jgi:hypothetical protein